MKRIIVALYCLLIISASGNGKSLEKTKRIGDGTNTVSSADTNKFTPSRLGYVTNVHEQKIDAQRTRNFWNAGGFGGCCKRKPQEKKK